jgi:predicted O-methyltransferase YrrM
MDTALATVLARLEARSEREEAEAQRLSREEFERRRDEWMLAVGRDAGALLNLLARLGGCRRILEVGTSVGYSTLWLADAARATGGRVTTLDNVAAKHEQARANLAEAGLAGLVDLASGDALQSIARLPGPWDFVLLDFNRGLYRKSLEALLPKLAPGAVVAADNMLRPEASLPQARQYQDWVRLQPGLQSLLVPIGNGIELTRKQE